MKAKDITKELLHELYWDKGMSTRDIARELDVGQTTVRRKMKQFDVPARESKVAQQMPLCQEKLQRAYQTYRETYVQIIHKVCAWCGKEFTVTGSHKRQKYCSDECRALARRKGRKPKPPSKPRPPRKKYYCKDCGKEIILPKGQYYKRVYCDECLAKRKGSVIDHCGYCGKEIKVILSRYKKNKYNYCNVECMAKHYAQIYTGENSPTWNGGKRHYKGNWLQQRKLAIERDNHTCQLCGKTEEENGKSLDVHHIKPYKSFEDKFEANDLDNLVSLCHHCHRFVHSTHNTDKIFIK